VPGEIVVGVDDSEHAKAALRWAADEAKLRGARLVAVHAWTFVAPAAMGEPGLIAVPAGNLAAELEAERRAAETSLESTVNEVLGDAAGLEVERMLVEEDAGAGIVAAAKEADLIVVGTRGRGSLTQALLGSVSHHVVQHAPCPVVIVRAPEHG
jgi:nucleotide-binding universal stress UspA family protein